MLAYPGAGAEGQGGGGDATHPPTLSQHGVVHTVKEKLNQRFT